MTHVWLLWERAGTEDGPQTVKLIGAFSTQQKVDDFVGQVERSEAFYWSEKHRLDPSPQAPRP